MTRKEVHINLYMPIAYHLFFLMIVIFFSISNFFAENFLPIHFSEKFVYFDNFLDIFLFMITSNNVCSVGNGMGELIYSVSLSLMMCMCVCMCVAVFAFVCV